MIEPARFLDVNVPMYAAGRDHPYKECCVWVMTEIANERISTAIDVEIIQEILHRYGALDQWGIAVTMATRLLELVPIVYPVRIEDARSAVGMVEQYAPRGIKARDLLHAAVMLNNGLREVISTDAHFDGIQGVTRIDPRELFERSRGA